jgi:membrane-associated phospholipid phosphatase
MLVNSVAWSQSTDSVHLTQHKERFKIRQLYIPLALITTGIVLNDNSEESFKMEIKEERNEYFHSYSTHLDDYLQYSPIAIAYALDAFGVHSRTDVVNRSAILMKGEFFMLAATYAGKTLSHELRPDGSDFSSFPSGHTAQAFAAATFLSEEYKNRIKWMPYAAYALASVVGGLRIANNKHYVNDVIAGAGVGILSMKLSYWTHQYKWGRQKNKVTTVLF